MDRRPAAVRDTYDRIAGHFAQTREYPWPEVESFLADAPAGGVALDLGCGNGRHAELLAERADRVVGADVSSGLLETARDRAAERGFAVDLLQCDAAALPLATDAVAVAVYVATLHHLPTREARVASLDELARVLAPDGVALVSVWSTAHDRFDADEGFDTTVDWTLPGGETVPRFYHVYSPAEFEADLGDSDLTVRKAFVSSGNCYAAVEPAAD
ncbi:class I SAM-dependent methyltransferase [Halostella salina]|uniref:class I SAM-dependent methyltransferase n=1 Tax=Halostella salina TaxID=1547897 RepID=UPI000EF80040|nr:class I SAM-dependent methyltransferase [Halostella salina]